MITEVKPEHPDRMPHRVGLFHNKRARNTVNNTTYSIGNYRADKTRGSEIVDPECANLLGAPPASAIVRQIPLILLCFSLMAVVVIAAGHFLS